MDLKTETTTGIIGYRLRRAQISVFQRFQSAFADVALKPAEYSTLELIAENPGRKQIEIGEVLGIKRANFVVIVHQLQDRGLVERRADAGDKRANALYLSRAGEALLEKARAIQSAFEQDCVHRLGGGREKQTLFELLDRLT
ncbi:MarR family winged helix-turn-helix transcriptional regulator [Devosia sp. RR2S18]|uniref:MarR family winged helix-turn-helix transcriptional regulator n=1 Tax=Devosia rhizosphaerae TaxID=3049774 RepID=UPI0025404EC7|nr:MarR family winged helix-turn-helix transcriptional regulator [Devosia sp. RR2S18]WIJ25074.1 MarR family winged helix-turn-helix transcriptional regulator [Devosia sp. RR2S18]